MINNKAILGKNIKLLREKLNIAQDDFADRIKLSTQTVSLIEAGKYFTTAETLDKICTIFEIPPSSLFELDSHFIRTTYEKKVEIVKDINILLKNLNEDKLRLVSEYIQFLNDRKLSVTYDK